MDCVERESTIDICTKLLWYSIQYADRQIKHHTFEKGIMFVSLDVSSKNAIIVEMICNTKKLQCLEKKYRFDI